MSCVGTKEPVAIESDGYLLYLLAFVSHILYLMGQVVREASPRSCVVTRCPMRRELTHHPIEALRDAM
jgi:hypothetical protein